MAGPRTAARAAAAALLTVLAGCGGADARPAAGPAAGAAGDQAPAGGGQRPAAQATPGAVAAAFYQALGDARFGEACSLFAPATQARIAAIGRDCPTELAETYREKIRDAIGTVVVDESKVEVVGDTATVPGDALANADQPAGAAAPGFARVRTTLQNGLWYIVT